MIDFTIDEVDNILLNLSCGLKPSDLCEDEVKLIEEKYGENWFEQLGYSEPEYSKPTF